MKHIHTQRSTVNVVLKKNVRIIDLEKKAYSKSFKKNEHYHKPLNTNEKQSNESRARERERKRTYTGEMSYIFRAIDRNSAAGL